MPSRNPDFEAAARRAFEEAPFIKHLGVTLTQLAEGRCEMQLAVRAEHTQQDGFVHAGVIATIADHAAGIAGVTMIAADELVLSAEFKINLIKPATGPALLACGEVLRAGRRLVIAEASVYSGEASALDSVGKDGGVLVAKLMQTLAVVGR